MALQPPAQSRRVSEALRKLEPEIRKAFDHAIQKAAGSVDVVALANAIEAGDLARALDVLRINQAILFPLDDAIRAGYVAGGNLVARDLPRGFAARWAFDGNTERAQAFIRRQGGDLIEGITEDAIQTAQKVITERLGEGVDHRAIARELTGRKVGNRRVGGFLGLNSDQTDSIIRARQMLSDPNQIGDYFIKDAKTGRLKPRFKLSDRRFDAKVKKAIKDGKALSGPDLDQVMEAHRSKALGYRGRVIAKDQAHTALAEGRREAYAQIEENPEVETVTKRWQHNLSQEPREDHQRMDGTVIEFSEKFVMDDDTQMEAPHDPAGGARHNLGCSCIAIYRVRFRRD